MSVQLIDDEVGSGGAQLGPPENVVRRATTRAPEFIRFSICFRLLYHCFLFVAVFPMSIPVHSPFLS
jgi:hypothetical protein